MGIESTLCQSGTSKLRHVADVNCNKTIKNIYIIRVVRKILQAQFDPLLSLRLR